MIPDLDELLRRVRVVRLSLRRRFRGITWREAALFNGPSGWSEFSPFLEYDDAESATWLAAAIDFGWRDTPPARRTHIPVNATVPAVPAREVATVLAEYPGSRTAKVKVAEPGQTLADDLARVRATRESLGPDANIRIDANGLWSVEQAERALEMLAPYRLEYVEQPCSTVDELTILRTRLAGLGVLIAADESVRKAADPIAVARRGAADILVVKAQPLGGVRAALRIVAEAGLPAVVSSALDTSVGIAMGAALAAALPSLKHDCGLGTVAMFERDVTRAPLLPQNGAIHAGRPVPDSETLQALAAPPERVQWWIERIRRCYSLLPVTGKDAPER